MRAESAAGPLDLPAKRESMLTDLSRPFGITAFLLLSLGCGVDPTSPPEIESGTFVAQTSGLHRGALMGEAVVYVDREGIINGAEALSDDIEFLAVDPESGITFELGVRWVDEPRLRKGSFRCSSSYGSGSTEEGLWGRLGLRGSDGEHGFFFTPACEIRVTGRNRVEVFGTLDFLARGFYPQPGDNQFGSLRIEGTFRARIADG